MRALRLVGAVLLSVALVAGCGSDEGDDPTVGSPSEGGTATSSPRAAAPTPCQSAPPTQEPRPSTGTDLATKPVVEAGEGDPPCGLVVRDVVVGTGAEVVPGSQVQARYVGAFFDSGEQFDASWDNGPDSTLPFTAGGGNLIPGFDQGVLGMRVGGRREVVIPSDLAYGPTGQGPIPPDATLLFVIDVVDVQGP